MKVVDFLLCECRVDDIFYFVFFFGCPIFVVGVPCFFEFFIDVDVVVDELAESRVFIDKETKVRPIDSMVKPTVMYVLVDWKEGMIRSLMTANGIVVLILMPKIKTLDFALMTSALKRWVISAALTVLRSGFTMVLSVSLISMVLPSAMTAFSRAKSVLLIVAFPWTVFVPSSSMMSILMSYA